MDMVKKMSMRFQVNDLLDLTRKYFSGDLRKEDELENFSQDPVLKGQCYDADLKNGIALSTVVSHADMKVVMDRLQNTIVFVDTYSVLGFYIYVLEVIIHRQDPKSERNRLYPQPTAQHKTDALRVMAGYLSDQLFGKRKKNGDIEKRSPLCHRDGESQFIKTEQKEPAKI